MLTEFLLNSTGQELDWKGIWPIEMSAAKLFCKEHFAVKLYPILRLRSA
jgi:hypothetical protein